MLAVTVHDDQLSFIKHRGAPIDISSTAGDDRPRQRTTLNDKPAGNDQEARSLDATLLTTNEAATRLRIHPRTVQRLVAAGALRCVRLGSAVRFDPADIAALIERLKYQQADQRSPR